MFNSISSFFKNLFSGLFGGGDKSKPATPGKSTPPTRTISNLPKAEPDAPQDAPEVVINKDTAEVVEVVDEKEIVILEPGDDPSNDPIDNSTEPEVETKPEEEPVIIETPTEVTTPPVTETKPKHKARYMWCLDNGHGKQTAGKRSPKFEDGKQFFEYEFNRDIVKRVSKQLDELGVKYFNVVPEVDIDNFLEGRVDRANNLKSNLPKIFLSIHSNAFGNSDWEPPSGIETWFYHNSRSGRALASVFQKHLVAKLGWVNRNLKSYPGSKQFYVLRNTKMPAVLTENGFYTNKEECRLLLQDSTRQKIADAHVAAILEIEKNGI
jgi:N-acetylmuramoyl-L-alanine amidase